MALVALVIPMLYPTGRLLGRGWRVPLVVGLVASSIGTLCFALAPGNLGGYPEIHNPVGLDGAGWIARTGDLVMLLFVVAVVAAIVSMGIRYRRSQGDERQQLKWFLLVLTVLAGVFLIGVPYWSLGGQGGSLDVVETLLVASPWSRSLSRSGSRS